MCGCKNMRKVGGVCTQIHTYVNVGGLSYIVILYFYQHCTSWPVVIFTLQEEEEENNDENLSLFHTSLSIIGDKRFHTFICMCMRFIRLLSFRISKYIL